MKFYWADGYSIEETFGSLCCGLIHVGSRPYLCVYLQWELDAYIAGCRHPKVGWLMANRYIRNVVQPSLEFFKGEVLLSKEYP